MFGFKKLLKRIKSLEDLFGITYHVADNKECHKKIHAK